MLAAYTESEKQNTAFTLTGAKSLLSSNRDAKAETSAAVASNNEASLDSCSFASIFSEPTEGELMTFAKSCESCGSIAYDSSESCGSVAFASSESCGSVASSSASSSGSFSGCSYSC